jgi:hypothetical protein
MKDVARHVGKVLIAACWVLAIWQIGSCEARQTESHNRATIEAMKLGYCKDAWNNWKACAQRAEKEQK